ncbi:hypothetical protein R3X25_12420 [Lutibacter sp. TH_r2]|uniref:hypothetical protein n=1 Tax=Lutibacter sp. TH_r2 TaxID=3082083 RepID=UPI002955CCDA|nr:hypothetical protein [Lutibacter sp. TH_r2]MDV7188089.1 hypothetical protein [Lutibacter sp. TH_r2]
MINSVSKSTQDFFEKSFSSLNLENSRKQLLKQIAIYISNEIRTKNKINLIFICPDNNIRSQISQVWASYAADFFNLKNITCFSGGTNVTCFSRNTVKTLQHVGFQFQILEFSHQNPQYSISYKNCTKPIIGFSKLYDNHYNQKPSIAIITSSSTEKNHPYITNSIKHFNLHYINAKQFDSSLYRSEKYLEINQEIAGEIYFIFKKISELL